MGRPLHRIVTISADGARTQHWQVADLAMARKMAAWLAGQTTDRVKLCSYREVIQVVETEIEVSAAISRVEPAAE